MSNDVATEIDRLCNLPLGALRSEWLWHHPDRSLPHRLPRDLLVRTIAWKLQEPELRGAAAAVSKRLDKLSAQLSRSGVLDCEREAQVKIGTTLMREWRGETYRVTALDDGFLWNGQRYESLSEIARAITGVRWSGPRFFGLKQKQREASTPSAEQVHG